MEPTITVISVVAALGAALIGGVFFAFSSFVMKALARLPAAEGIAAMQSINIVVINRSFLGVFFGTAVLSLVLAIVSVLRWDQPSIWLLAGGISYLVGTLLVTRSRNIPLNEELAVVIVTDPASRELWTHYMHKWMLWNHVRTVAAIAAASCYFVESF